MTTEPEGELGFECLSCGQSSPLWKKLQGAAPKCARCGSKSGILGDIGQGSPRSRLRRRNTRQADEQPARFECLRCGHATRIDSERTRPRCPHCGSLSGILIEIDGH